MSQNGVKDSVQTGKIDISWDEMKNSYSEVNPGIYPEDVVVPSNKIAQPGTTEYTLHSLGPKNKKITTVCVVSTAIVIKVMDYWYHHSENKKESKEEGYEIDSWDAQFLKVEPEELFELMRAANDFGVERLVHACKKMARINKEKYERCLAFNATNDVTPEKQERA